MFPLLLGTEFKLAACPAICCLIFLESQRVGLEWPAKITNRNSEQKLHAPFGLLKDALEQKMIVIIQFKGMHGLGLSRLIAIGYQYSTKTTFFLLLQLMQYLQGLERV